MSCRAWFSDDAQTPPADPVLAICVGHSRYNDMGAVACDEETNEWTYNLQVAKSIKEELDDAGVPSVIVHEYTGNNYSESMKNLSVELKELKVTSAIELHFNAATPAAHGSEMLYWHKSKKSEKLAQCLQDQVVETFGVKDRGVKPKTAKSRGARFLKETHCPAVITEPFFGSNQEDWDMFEHSFDTLGSSLAKGFINYYNNEKTGSQLTQRTQV